MNVREATIERHWVREWERIGGRSLKFVSPGLRGVPDRLNACAGLRPFFVEFKAPGEKPTPQQSDVHQQLDRVGIETYVVSSIEQADRLLYEMRDQTIR